MSGKVCQGLPVVPEWCQERCQGFPVAPGWCQERYVSTYQLIQSDVRKGVSGLTCCSRVMFRKGESGLTCCSRVMSGKVCSSQATWSSFSSTVTVQVLYTSTPPGRNSDTACRTQHQMIVSVYNMFIHTTWWDFKILVATDVSYVRL